MLLRSVENLINVRRLAMILRLVFVAYARAKCLNPDPVQSRHNWNGFYRQEDRAAAAAGGINRGDG